MFAILVEVRLIENQEEIPHFPGWERGGVNERKNCEQKFCEQTGAFPTGERPGPKNFGQALATLGQTSIFGCGKCKVLIILRI